MVSLAVFRISINFPDVHSQRPFQSKQRWGIERTATLLTALWCFVIQTFGHSTIYLVWILPLLSQFRINLVFPSVLEKNIFIVGKRVIPRQLMYSVLSPIFLKFWDISFFHSGHYFSNFIEFLNNSYSWCLLSSTCTKFYTFSFVSYFTLLPQLIYLLQTSFVPALSSSPLT